MSKVTNQDLMKKLKKIERQLHSDRSLSLGFSICSIGIAIIGIGIVLNYGGLILLGIILVFVPPGLWLLHRDFISKKTNVRFFRISIFTIVIAIISFGIVLDYGGLLFGRIILFFVFIELLYFYSELILEKEKKEGKKMNFRKYMEKYFYPFTTPILLLVIMLLSGFILTFFGNAIGLMGKITIAIFFYLSISMFSVRILVELLLKIPKSKNRILQKIYTRYKKRYKKTPRIFEFAFFVLLFWATFFLSVLYSKYEGNLTDLQKWFDFLETIWILVIFYGLAIGCGIIHYVERLDE